MATCVDMNGLIQPLLEQTLFIFRLNIKFRFRTNQFSEYLMVFRLAEQYLIRAEARVYSNDFSGSLSDLNMLKSRAGLPAISVQDA